MILKGVLASDPPDAGELLSVRRPVTTEDIDGLWDERPKGTYVPAPGIHYTFVIPNTDLTRVTPFQGFTPGLLWTTPLMGMLPTLPADTYELTMDPDSRLARRRAGHGHWMWTPLSLGNLARRKPQPWRPLQVFFTVEKEAAKAVSALRRNLRIRPLHVSTERGFGAISPAELTVERLQQFCRIALRQAHEADRRAAVDTLLAEVGQWVQWASKPTSLHYHSHNVVVANQMVLMSAGEARATGEEGHLNLSPEADYVAGIVESARAVMALRERADGAPIELLAPAQPALILVAPAPWVSFDKLAAGKELLPAQKAALRSLARQRGYTLQMDVDREQLEQIAPLMSLRGAELKLQSTAIGLRAICCVAATVRLPPAVNRTSGVVAQLGRHMREIENPSPRKAIKVFEAVQSALLKAIDPQLLALIAETKGPIKIVGDAPIEWLSVDGLPLGVRFDTSRIDSTPGNILMEQLRPLPNLYLPPDAFKDYLVVSMFNDGDGIANHLRASLRTMQRRVDPEWRGTTAMASTVDEFIEAVNAHSGPLLIVDSHGTHDEDTNVGGLIIGGKPIDVWTLRGRIKPPPIVILSACDTHPYDRSHATVANGFLACGAIAVIATVLPVRSIQASAFLSRLLLRAVEFSKAANGMGRAVAWTNIFGGAIRMQLAADLTFDLVARGLLPKELRASLQLEANTFINGKSQNWLGDFKAKAMAMGGFDEAAWVDALNGVIAISDVIRYVHVGNPEAIIITSQKVMDRAIAATHPDDSEIAHAPAR